MLLICCSAPLAKLTSPALFLFLVHLLLQLAATLVTKRTLDLLAAVPNFTLTIRQIKTDGCPNHPCFCTGNPKREKCGPIGAEGNGTYARELTKAYKIMAHPGTLVDGAIISRRCYE
jgi:hypothetical protein